MTDDDRMVEYLVRDMRRLGDPLGGTSLYQKAATVIESLSRDLAAAKARIALAEPVIAQARNVSPKHCGATQVLAEKLREYDAAIAALEKP